MKKTKIVCTIGPASESENMLEALIGQGMNVCRLNFSHGNHEEHQARIDTIKKVRKKMNATVAIMLDTKGPEIRTGKFSTKEVPVYKGNTYIITMEDVVGDDKKCSVSYKGLINDIDVGGTILIDDGLISLKVVKIEGPEIHCLLENDGVLKDNKGVNVPGVKIQLPSLTEKDISDLIFGIKNGVDFIAASFIRKAADVLAIREILEEHQAEHIHIISKIENQEGVDNIDEILEVCEGVMVARGDLGVEIPTEDIPIVQKMLIQKANLLSKPVITATQMLDSMIRNPRPTRAEVTDVANAIFDGTDAIMLSGETAAGDYPLEAVKTMATIAKRTEGQLDYDQILRSKVQLRNINITNAISHASCTTALDLKATAILTATASGHTARMVASYRPEAPIIVSTYNEQVMRKMCIVWGTTPLMTERASSSDEQFELSVEAALDHGFIQSGDLVVITAGVPVGKAGTTNLIKVHVAVDLIVRGIGVGTGKIIGRAKIFQSMDDQIEEGDILITTMTDSDMMPMIEKASAIITEQGGLTSHAAVVGVSLGIPVIVSAKNIMNEVEDGEYLTIDANLGNIYKGKIEMI